MKQGDDGDGMVVITRGSVKVSIGDLVVDIMGRGAVIGEMAVLGGVPELQMWLQTLQSLLFG